MRRTSSSDVCDPALVESSATQCEQEKQRIKELIQRSGLAESCRLALSDQGEKQEVKGLKRLAESCSVTLSGQNKLCSVTLSDQKKSCSVTLNDQKKQKVKEMMEQSSLARSCSVTLCDQEMRPQLRRESELSS